MFNMRQLLGQLRRMGIQVKELKAKRVIIELADRRIILENPEVLKLGSPQGPLYQILGSTEKIEENVEIDPEDVKFVAEQTGVSEEVAKKYLLKHKGDIAKAIEDILNNEKGTKE
jgi:nascent polypeptide-associated complex subunit alpha